MMLQLLAEIAILSLLVAYAVRGLSYAGEPGFVLDRLNEWAQQRLPNPLYKVWLGCPVCMPSWWGSVAFCFWFGISGPPVWALCFWPVVICTASGINAQWVRDWPAPFPPLTAYDKD